MNRLPTSNAASIDQLRLKLTMKALGAGVWDYDIAADRLYCDARWYEIIGLDPAAIEIQRLDDFKPFIHPDDVALATRIDPSEVEELIARDERYHVEFRIVQPGGKIRKLRSVACIVRDDATGHQRAIGCVLDITDVDNERDLFGEASPGAAPAESGGVLSRMERECLAWVTAGKTAWETSVILGRSRKTIEFHLANAARKLGASNKVQAAALAIRQGLL